MNQSVNDYIRSYSAKINKAYGNGMLENHSQKGKSLILIIHLKIIFLLSQC